MATTGANLYQLFGEKVDKDYTEYINEARFNRLAKVALIQLIDKIYRQKDTQKEHDELSELTVIDRGLNINANRFHIRPLRITNISIIGLTIQVSLADAHNLQVGDAITFSDVQGVTTLPNLNQTHTITAVPNSNVVELTFNIAPTGSYNQGTGRVTHLKMIDDYYHLFAVKCRFENTDQKYSISNITGSSVIRITFSSKTILRSNKQAVISGVVGTTNANGMFYLKQIGRLDYELYYDAALQQPVPLNAAYISGGTVSEVMYRYADRISPDEKYSETQKATVKEPMYIEDQSTILVYPREQPCNHVMLDYMRKPSVEIDANDNVADLENVYSLKFLLRLMNETADQFLVHIHEFAKAGAERTITMENR